MLSIRSVPVSPHTYCKDPFSSELGERIVLEGVGLLNTIGFEAFTFKKLASKIQSTEASVYRYFSNKHSFLAFLTNLYWTWLEQRIRQIPYAGMDHTDRLNKALAMLVSPVAGYGGSGFPYQALVQVVISEGPKVYLVKYVDQANQEGVFLAYKSLCEALSQLILSVNPQYQFAHSLSSTVIESVHDQLFFSEHLPRLTDIDTSDKLMQFISHLVSKSIEHYDDNKAIL